ncbi:hypothetical protein [Peribacillus loiseleuriae]|uniref:Inner spore coat protein n=1 Tax=Peribacillus loiseleuriae TaxID=1679170 RepID=A0A0K9GYJ8_9BACI|nr:hypothetical protein [Peribacillus loiseleuriae]KMY51680.1 hypothetical protein AC625_20885 [Peribacillus loiseleuriae]
MTENHDGFPHAYPHSQHHDVFRPFPSVNPDLLIQSAKNSQSLLLDAQKVVNTFAMSRPFSERLMAAAQQSKTAIVTDMIRKTGVKTVPDTTFNPDGIRFDFHPKVQENCCHIIVSLKWLNF